MSIPGIEPRKVAGGEKALRTLLLLPLFLVACFFLYPLFFSRAPRYCTPSTARLGYRENPINQVRAGAHEMDIFAKRAAERGVTLLARVPARRRACARRSGRTVSALCDASTLFPWQLKRRPDDRLQMGSGKMATGDRSEAARFIMITTKEFTSRRATGPNSATTVAGWPRDAVWLGSSFAS